MFGKREPKTSESSGYQVTAERAQRGCGPRVSAKSVLEMKSLDFVLDVLACVPLG